MPDDVLPGDEDYLGYTAPATPSQLRKMSDDDLARLYRRNAFANLHALSSMIEQELRVGLIAALKDHAAEMHAGGRRMERLNIILLALAIAATVAAVVSAIDGLTRLF